MADVRYLTLWEMLRWCYRQQKAHLYLKRPMDWFMWAISTYNLVEDSPRPEVDADAAVLHAGVVELAHDDAEMVVFFAASGQQPELCADDPVPHPVGRGARSILDGDDYSWATIAGRRAEYLTRVAEVFTVKTPVLRRVGNRKSKVVGYRYVQHDVRFCPLDWDPDLQWVQMRAGIHRRWVAAMQNLMAVMHTVSFNNHVVTGVGIDQNETAPEFERIDTGNKITSTDVALEGGRVIYHDECTAFRRWARARNS